MTVIACMCIGVACALLSPRQPESLIATVLLIEAWRRR